MVATRVVTHERQVIAHAGRRGGARRAKVVVEPEKQRSRENHGQHQQTPTKQTASKTQTTTKPNTGEPGATGREDNYRIGKL
jgi:hypothetical protein